MAKKPIEPSDLPEPDEPIDTSDLPEPSDLPPTKEPIKINKDGALQFEKLENIVKRLERIDLSPSDLPESNENKSKVGLIAFILIFAVGIVGYFLFKKPENMENKA